MARGMKQIVEGIIEGAPRAIVDPETGDASGRPAGVTVGADGALYVSDDKGGYIYRVVSDGEPASASAGPIRARSVGPTRTRSV